MEAWILFTLLAVAMQSVRTAAQKQIAQSISAASTTLVRYLFGLPFALGYYFSLFHFYQGEEFVGNTVFYKASTLAAIAQIFATVFLIKALTLRNFAVGTALVKTEALLTAVLGAVFFSTALSSIAYLSVFLGVVGVLIASNWKVSWRDLVENESIKYGVGAGLGFALLWHRYGYGRHLYLWMCRGCLVHQLSCCIWWRSRLCYACYLWLFGNGINLLWFCPDGNPAFLLASPVWQAQWAGSRQ